MTIYSIQLKILKYRDDFLIISLGFFSYLFIVMRKYHRTKGSFSHILLMTGWVGKVFTAKGLVLSLKKLRNHSPGLASFSWRWSGHHLIGKSQKDRTVLCHSTVLNNFLLVGRRILLVATLVYPSTSMTAIRRSSSQLTWMKPKTQRFCYQSMFYAES